MPLISIPNVSEGRVAATVRRLEDALTNRGCRVLDAHSDPVHNRSVFTATGDAGALVEGLSGLATAAVTSIDLTVHTGAHPRVGPLDVCPIVPHDGSMAEAVTVAHATAAAISERAGLPVYLYGAAAEPPRSLPDIRRGGLDELIARARAGDVPDLGPAEIDPSRGVVCVGARPVLIAFNVWIRGTVVAARVVARAVRERTGGLRGVRALGLDMPGDEAQVSMNLTQPDLTGIEDAFAAVAESAQGMGAEVVKTEIVGLVPERYLPTPDAQAARLLIEPGRSLESLLI